MIMLKALISIFWAHKSWDKCPIFIKIGFRISKSSLFLNCPDYLFFLDFCSAIGGGKGSLSIPSLRISNNCFIGFWSFDFEYENSETASNDISLRNSFDNNVLMIWMSELSVSLWYSWHVKSINESFCIWYGGVFGKGNEGQYVEMKRRHFLIIIFKIKFLHLRFQCLFS